MSAARRFVVAILLFVSAPAATQVNNPAYADYLLVGRFGEICTMCEAVVRCAEGDNTADFTLYHLQTRTFWSQISTIWEWFISNFDSGSLARSGHSRPVIVYTVSGGKWSQPQTINAHLSLEPARIDLGDRHIDRIERRWLSADGARELGRCERLPLWETLEKIEARG